MLVDFHTQTGPGLTCQADTSADDTQRIPNELLARDNIVVQSEYISLRQRLSQMSHGGQQDSRPGVVLDPHGDAQLDSQIAEKPELREAAEAV